MARPASGNQNGMADFSERVRRSFEEPAAGHDTAPNAGADEQTEEFGATLTGAMPPFSNGGGPNVVRNDDGATELRGESFAERHILPTQVWSMPHHTGLLVHLARNPDPDSTRGRARSEVIVNDLNQVADHFVRAFVAVEGPTRVREDPTVLGHDRGGDLRGTEVNSKYFRRGERRLPDHHHGDTHRSLSRNRWPGGRPLIGARGTAVAVHEV